MKSPEQWCMDFLKTQAHHDKLSGVLMPKFVKAIQQDARKAGWDEGMREAAAMVDRQSIHSDFSLRRRGGARLMSEKILQAIEQKKEQ